MDSSDPKDSGVSSKTTELKRSARLSKKRTLKDDSVAEISDRLDDSNKAKKLCNTLKSNKTKSKISVTPKNDNKTYNNQDSVMSITKVSSEFSNVSNVQPSLNTIVDEGEKTPVKSLPLALKNKISSEPPIVTNVKNMSTMYNVNTTEHKNSDDLVKLARKRGRPPQKELQLLLRDSTVKVNRCYKDEVERQKTGKGFLEPVEKSLDVYESDSTIIQDDANHTSTPERNNHDCEPSKSKRKRIKIKSSTFNVENVANDSCLSVGSTGSVKSVSTTTSEHAEVLPDDANKPQLSRDETFDCEIALISNRFNVPCDTLRNIIERESVPVFREKYSDTVTLSMVTVSPVVSMTNKGKHASRWDSNGAPSVKYKIEPIRESVAYEKNNLKDTMVEISKAMPSWSLSIVADPPRYVISHMSIETYGTPVADKSVVLDRHFRASIYINQRLEYKYCKRYTTASEIVDLIKELDTI